MMMINKFKMNNIEKKEKKLTGDFTSFYSFYFCIHFTFCLQEQFLIKNVLFGSINVGLTKNNKKTRVVIEAMNNSKLWKTWE